MMSAVHENTVAAAGMEGMRPDNWNARAAKSFGMTEITLEPNRVPMVRNHKRRLWPRWCPTCGYGFRTLSASTSAALADVSIYTIYRWAETGEIHFGVTAEGALLICLDSLLERVSAQPRQATINLAIA